MAIPFKHRHAFPKLAADSLNLLRVRVRWWFGQARQKAGDHSRHRSPVDARIDPARSHESAGVRLDFYTGSLERATNFPDLSGTDTKRFADLRSGRGRNHIDMPILPAFGASLRHGEVFPGFAQPSDGRLHPPHNT